MHVQKLTAGVIGSNYCNLSLACLEELRLTYDVLPLEVKTTFRSATDNLRDRLQPVKREALKPAELIKREMQNETADSYAQFERLFLKSY